MTETKITGVKVQRRRTRASKKLSETKPKPPAKKQKEEKITVDFGNKVLLLEDLDKFDGDKSWMESHIEPCLSKFGTKFNFTFNYIPKFKAFQCLRDNKHVDWITLNDLLKRYDTGIKLHASIATNVQRPSKRVYD